MTYGRYWNEKFFTEIDGITMTFTDIGKTENLYKLEVSVSVCGR